MCVPRLKVYYFGLLQAFREYYPSTERVLTLDCVWREDKFFLVEKTENRNIENRNEDLSAVPFTTSVQYETFELFDEGRSIIFIELISFLYKINQWFF